jgi:hypothetical protein
MTPPELAAAALEAEAAALRDRGLTRTAQNNEWIAARLRGLAWMYAPAPRRPARRQAGNEPGTSRPADAAYWIAEGRRRLAAGR